jgi:hypothetical protein
MSLRETFIKQVEENESINRNAVPEDVNNWIVELDNLFQSEDGQVSKDIFNLSSDEISSLIWCSVFFRFRSFCNFMETIEVCLDQAPGIDEIFEDSPELKSIFLTRLRLWLRTKVYSRILGEERRETMSSLTSLDDESIQ